MCGIAGIHAYHYAANAVDRGELTAMRDQMAARGPDGHGDWHAEDGRVGLGHRRLAIIDLTENGRQPMQSADGQLVVTFNGEIYNFAVLRAELEAKGCVFRSKSDTEVLLHLYAARGVEMVHDLQGMFAFALWDGRSQTMLLARDPYGIKPLYYSDDGWTCRFASQVKALLAGGRISRDPDPAGGVGFYLFGSVPEPFTTYRAIRAVPAGATVLVDRTGAHAPRRYHSIAAEYCRNADVSRASDIAEQTRAALLDSVRAHLVGDVPVGAFLSAGIDSGALVGLMRDAGAREIETVTVGFEEFQGKPEDETVLAGEVASTYATLHTTRIVTRAEFEADLPRIMTAMDQPSIDGINTWFVSKAARERGLKVAISGLGGDELFGGYPAFRDVPRWVRAAWLPACVPLLGRSVRYLAGAALARLAGNPKAAGLIEYGGSYAGAYLLRRGLFMPWELTNVLDTATVRDGLARLAPMQLMDRELTPRPRQVLARVAALEAGLYMRNQLLRDTDWASMAHSIEVRVPLVDSRLLTALAPGARALGTGGGKRLLAAAPSRPLPDAVVNRAKTGFTTPVAAGITGHVSKNARSGVVRRVPWARDWSRHVGEQQLLTQVA